MLEHRREPDFDDDHSEDESDAFVYAAGRGVTHGYCRSTVERSRAVVVGCNYPNAQNAPGQVQPLKGGCADAQAWAKALTGRLGVPEQSMALLTDTTPEGAAVHESNAQYPSQSNIMKHLRWVVGDSQPGDTIVFVFCGHGCIAPQVSDEDLEAAPEAGDEEYTIEEGLLCADYATGDWTRGYSMRMISSEMLVPLWTSLPRGVVLTLIMDCAHGTSMLPVGRRLDSVRIPHDVSFTGEIQPLMEPLVFGVDRTVADTKLMLRNAQRHHRTSMSKAGYKARDAGGVWVKPTWLQGAVRGAADAFATLGGTPGMDQEVQAFAFTACGPAEVAGEAAAKTGQCSGLLTSALLSVLETMNFQGNYYELWFRAAGKMRETSPDVMQSIQLSFSDVSDPTIREVFAPVSNAEAMAYLKRTELHEMMIEEASDQTGPACFAMCDATGKASNIVLADNTDEEEHEYELQKNNPRRITRAPLGCPGEVCTVM